VPNLLSCSARLRFHGFTLVMTVLVVPFAVTSACSGMLVPRAADILFGAVAACMPLTVRT
jgi:hypothetical protein